MQTFYCGAGGVVSADIAVPEHEKELAFYAAVLTTGDAPLWRDDLINSEGTPIIGLGARTPQYASLPLQWMPHFQVADVAASVERGIALGGSELLHGKDDDGVSQWACVADPAGVAFGLIPALASDAMPAGVPASGHIAGLSLASADAGAAARFYAGVIGWRAREADSAYEMIGADERLAARISTLAQDANSAAGVWLLHLPVADLAASVARVGAHGGSVVHDASAAGYAVVRDPVGVYFAVQRAP